MTGRPFGALGADFEDFAVSNRVTTPAFVHLLASTVDLVHVAAP